MKTKTEKHTPESRAEYRADLEACFGSAWLDMAHTDALLMDDRRDGRGLEGMGEGYTESEFYDEMGYTLEDRIAAQASKDVEAPIKVLSCGHFSHEDGGPADYGQECRI